MNEKYRKCRKEIAEFISQRNLEELKEGYDCFEKRSSMVKKDVEMISPGGSRTGTRTVFDKMIHDDQRVGSWLSPVNISTSGNLTIIESEHFNSPEHTHHCPPRSVMLVYRDSDTVKTLQLHVSK